MSMPYIRRVYNLPFLKRNVRVRFEGREGVVVSAPRQYVRVRFEGMRGDHIENLHPTWNIAYLDADGNELANFEEQKSK